MGGVSHNRPSICNQYTGIPPHEPVRPNPSHGSFDENRIPSYYSPGIRHLTTRGQDGCCHAGSIARILSTPTWPMVVLAFRRGQPLYTSLNFPRCDHCSPPLATNPPGPTPSRTPGSAAKAAVITIPFTHSLSGGCCSRDKRTANPGTLKPKRRFIGAAHLGCGSGHDGEVCTADPRPRDPFSADCIGTRHEYFRHRYRLCRPGHRNLFC
jgi:hypothetical protein